MQISNIVVALLIFVSIIIFPQSKYLLKHNNIVLPLNNRGILADVEILNNSKMNFKQKIVLYSSGFWLSGLNNGIIWSNGVASTATIEDYVPGTYLNSGIDSVANIYVVKKNDLPFGDSWLKWKNAVLLGADFYDGDRDGNYDPMDKNNNGKWDTDEDAPFIIGDETIWCAYKDSKPSIDRNFVNVKPQGIEIKQTIFTSNATEELKNTIFIRYKIENVGIITDKLDSVYFSVWADPDIGYHLDDLIGCDTILNSAFCYQKSIDTIFGISTPSLLIDIISGPHVYLPDITFEDSNSNNKFDSTDLPLDSAYSIYGLRNGVKYISGALRRGASAFSDLNIPFPTDPVADEFTIRSWALGKNFSSVFIDPCSYDLGEFLSGNCESADPRFLYSGDPLYLKGWINKKERDQGFALHTGPFQLVKGKPVEITVAYIIGEGRSPLESLKIAKAYSRKVQFLFDNNIFEESIEKDSVEIINDVFYDFVLYQNYPNPFNPLTKIKYNLDNENRTTLKVYNVLGQEIGILVDDIQNEGIYEIEFDGSNLSSGIYYYQLVQGAFSKTRRMLILK